jgi:hypothetical protein
MSVKTSAKVNFEGMESYEHRNRKTNNDKPNNDITIGKISLIGIIAYIAFLVYGWIR